MGSLTTLTRDLNHRYKHRYCKYGSAIPFMGVPCHGHLTITEDHNMHCSLLKEPIRNWCQLIVGGSIQEAEKCDLKGAEFHYHVCSGTAGVTPSLQ